MSLSFLSKKSWNTTNTAVQRNVFIAEEKAKDDAKKAVERERTIERERELEELERAIGGEEAVQKHQLGFMYKAPPNHPERNNKDGSSPPPSPSAPSSPPNSSLSSIATSETTDDPATLEFRRMLAGSLAPTAVNFDSSVPAEALASVSPAAAAASAAAAAAAAAPVDRKRLEGSADHRTSLEKTVGRGAGTDISLREQIARFPELRNAPMAKGMSATHVQVKFNPLGKTFRQVRCVVCGEWGHSKGERECKKGFNPFAMGSEKFKRDVNEGEVGMSEENAVYGGGEMGARKRKMEEESDSGSSSSSESSGERRKRKKKKKKKREKREKKRDKKDERRRLKAAKKYLQRHNE